ncbi:MAG TPA: J domain-containing protein, partial [Vicinamibacteria bacterium]|nr:J domain-containing protein [Vicinamibacteria bacterium]
MEKPRDYYQILGVARDATSATIKRAFRRLAKQYHPDVASDAEQAVEAFQELQAAYETLTDAERLEPLAWSFVRSPAAGDLRRPFHPGSVSGEILLTPQEASAGGVLPIDVPVSATCQA